MSEPVPRSVPQEQQDEETRTAMKRIGGFIIIATAVAVLAALSAMVLYAARAMTRTSTRWYRRAELRSPTSGDTRTGLTSPPPGKTTFSR